VTSKCSDLVTCYSSLVTNLCALYLSVFEQPASRFFFSILFDIERKAGGSVAHDFMIDPKHVGNESRSGPHAVSLLPQYMALGSGSMATSISSSGKGCMITAFGFTYAMLARVNLNFETSVFPDSPGWRRAHPESASCRWRPPHRAPFQDRGVFDGVRDIVPLKEIAHVFFHLKGAGAA